MTIDPALVWMQQEAAEEQAEEAMLAHARAGLDAPGALLRRTVESGSSWADAERALRVLLETGRLQADKYSRLSAAG